MYLKVEKLQYNDQLFTILYDNPSLCQMKV